MVNPLVRLDSASNLPWEKRADGRYWTHITLGVAGNRLDYWSVDKSGKPGKQTEVVTSRGLYSDKSLKSLAQLPILLTHPKNKRYELNREGLKVGQLTGNVARSDSNDRLIAEAFIDDYRAVQRIDQMLSQGQKPEASPCYDLDELLRTGEAGVFEQIRGVYDHVAAPLFPGGGRGGQNIGLHLDSKEFALDLVGCQGFAVAEPLLGGTSNDALQFFVMRSDGGENKMPTIRLDGKDYEVEKPVADEIARLQTERDSLKTRLDSTDSEAAINGAVTERLELWEKAMPILRQVNPEFRADYGWGADKIMMAAVAAHNKDLRPQLDSLDLGNAVDFYELKGMFNMLPFSQPKESRSDAQPVTQIDELLKMVNAQTGTANKNRSSSSWLSQSRGVNRSDSNPSGHDDTIQKAADTCWN